MGGKVTDESIIGLGDRILGKDFPDYQKPLTPSDPGYYLDQRDDSPELYNSLNEKEDKTSAFKKRINDALPYVTNAVNAFTKLPNPARPQFEQTINPELVDFGADKLELDRTFRGLSKGIDQSTSNPGTANANKVSVLGKVLEARGKLSQQEKNTNAGLTNQARQFNANIKARNIERVNDFNDASTSRTITQQRLRRENLADFSNKLQLSRRDKDMMELENRKLDILPEMYKDSGVVDRNLMDELLKEKYPKRRYGGKIKIKY